MCTAAPAPWLELGMRRPPKSACNRHSRRRSTEARTGACRIFRSAVTELCRAYRCGSRQCSCTAASLWTGLSLNWSRYKFCGRSAMLQPMWIFSFRRLVVLKIHSHAPKATASTPASALRGSMSKLSKVKSRRETTSNSHHVENQAWKLAAWVHGNTSVSTSARRSQIEA